MTNTDPPQDPRQGQDNALPPQPDASPANSAIEGAQTVTPEAQEESSTEPSPNDFQSPVEAPAIEVLEGDPLEAGLSAGGPLEADAVTAQPVTGEPVIAAQQPGSVPEQQSAVGSFQPQPVSAGSATYGSATHSTATHGSATHSTATQTAPPQQNDQQQSNQQQSYQQQSYQQPPPPPAKLYRSEDGPLAGVATGIANHFGFDPVYAQIAFVVLALFGGSGLLVYPAIWFLVPKAAAAGSHVTPKRRGVLPVVIGTVLLVTAFGTFLAGPGIGPGFAFGFSHFFWFLVLGLGIYLLVQRPDEVAAVGSSLRDLIPQSHAAQPATAGYTSPATAQPAAPPTGEQTPSAAPWAVPQTTMSPATSAAGSSSTTAKEAKPKSPPITSITLAVAAIGVGMLAGLNQISGISIESKALFGFVVGACGLGMLFASVRGRAWGLLPIGLIAAALIPLQTAGELSYAHGFGEREYRVTSQAELDDSYKLSAGELVLDLRQLELVSDDEVLVDLIAGELVVIVPEGLLVDITATANYGEVSIFGHSVSGTEVELHEIHPDPDTDPEASDASELPNSDQPVLTIIAETTFGEVRIDHDR